MLSLKADLASLRSEQLIARIEGLQKMKFEDEDGLIVNKGLCHPEPPPVPDKKKAEDGKGGAAAAGAGGAAKAGAAATTSTAAAAAAAAAAALKSRK